MPVSRFAWEQFHVWVLSEYGKSPGSWKYYSSRIRSMQRRGLDLDASLADPRELWRQGNLVIANSKSAGKSGHVVRNFQRALNWLSDYGRHLELEDLRYQHSQLDDQDLEDRVRRWRKWDLAEEPKALPKSVDADLAILRTYVHKECTPRCRRTQPVGRAHCYVTYLRRALFDVAYAMNDRRGEMPQVRKSGLLPHVGKIVLPRAMKGSLSGEVEVPWSLFWPESGLMQFLQVRVEVPGTDQVFTVPADGHRYKEPLALDGAGIYKHLKAMGDELGVPLTLVRIKRRALSDLDERVKDVRVTQAKARHASIENTITYLGQVTSSRQRRELAAAGVFGYDEAARTRAVGLDGRPLVPAGLSSHNAQDDRHQPADDEHAAHESADERRKGSPGGEQNDAHHQQSGVRLVAGGLPTRHDGNDAGRGRAGDANLLGRAPVLGQRDVPQSVHLGPDAPQRDEDPQRDEREEQEGQHHADYAGTEQGFTERHAVLQKPHALRPSDASRVRAAGTGPALRPEVPHHEGPPPHARLPAPERGPAGAGAHSLHGRPEARDLDARHAPGQRAGRPDGHRQAAPRAPAGLGAEPFAAPPAESSCPSCGSPVQRTPGSQYPVALNGAHGLLNHGMTSPLVQALQDVRTAFEPRRRRDGITRLPPAFWLDMLQAQLDEARDHLRTAHAYERGGRPDSAQVFRIKALAEIADCFSVGWQALEDNTDGAEQFIVQRIRTRIIPRVDELADRDLPKVRGVPA